VGAGVRLKSNYVAKHDIPTSLLIPSVAADDSMGDDAYLIVETELCADRQDALPPAFVADDGVLAITIAVLDIGLRLALRALGWVMCISHVLLSISFRIG